MDELNTDKLEEEVREIYANHLKFIEEQKCSNPKILVYIFLRSAIYLAYQTGPTEGIARQFLQLAISDINEIRLKEKNEYRN